MEIERKFLVDPKEWEKFPKPEPEKIQQGYLTNTPEITVRLRVKGSSGYLTIKGATQGISREEFEYEIPVSDVNDMVQIFHTPLLSKLRYRIFHEHHMWEIDVFEGKLEGLILAEIELESENEKFGLPSFVGKEVSEDPKYFNSNLIKNC